MDGNELIKYISGSEKKTPVKVYIRMKPGAVVAPGVSGMPGGQPHPGESVRGGQLEPGKSACGGQPHPGESVRGGQLEPGKSACGGQLELGESVCRGLLRSAGSAPGERLQPGESASAEAISQIGEPVYSGTAAAPELYDTAGESPFVGKLAMPDRPSFGERATIPEVPIAGEGTHRIEKPNNNRKEQGVTTQELLQDLKPRSWTFDKCKVFGIGDLIVFGDWKDVKPALDSAAPNIEYAVVENESRNSALPLLDIKNLPARVEPGAIIREQVNIGRGAIIMMGAIINIGASVGENTMIDMGAVLGGRAQVGSHCHIGAGAVLAGVIEPPGAKPVVVGDNALVGANAVLLEGVEVGDNSVVAAGAVVVDDVPSGCVVAGVPAKVIKVKDSKTSSKTEIVDALRQL